MIGDPASITADDTMEIIEGLILTNKEIGLLTSDIALKLLVE